MNRIVFTFILLCSVVFISNAQKTTMGIRGGLNVSSMGKEINDLTKDEGGDSKNKIGLHFGLFLDCKVGESFYIQPGLYYSRKGFKAKFEKRNADELTINLSYIELPVLASYRIKVTNNIRWHINAGSYFAYGIGGKIIESGPKKDSFGEDSMKSFDMGFSFGTGLGFNKRVYLELKYDLGVLDIANDDNNGTKLNNRNFAVSLGYILP